MKFIKVINITGGFTDEPIYNETWVNLDTVMVISPCMFNGKTCYEVKLNRYDLTIDEHDYQKILKAVQSWE